jgi:ComF family protein
MHQIFRTMQPLLDLLFPPQCAGCLRNGAVLCDTCLAKIKPIPSPFCQRCHAPLMVDHRCRKCAHHPLRLSGLRSAGAYQEPLRACIHALKYDGVTRMAQPLGLLLAQTYQRTGLRGDLVVPVPLHADRQYRRGYNHAALLARICAQTLGLPYKDAILTRVRDTAAQAGLSSQERVHNMVGAFGCATRSVVPAIAGKRVIIIDDVATTGATLEECAAPLFGIGAQAVWGLVLARPL